MSIDRTDLRYTCPFCGERGKVYTTEASTEYWVEHYRKNVGLCPGFYLSVAWDPCVEELVTAEDYKELKKQVELFNAADQQENSVEQPTCDEKRFTERNGNMVLARCCEKVGPWHCGIKKWVPLEGPNNDTLESWYCHIHRAAHQDEKYLHSDCRIK